MVKFQVRTVCDTVSFFENDRLVTFHVLMPNAFYAEFLEAFSNSNMDFSVTSKAREIHNLDDFKFAYFPEIVTHDLADIRWQSTWANAIMDSAATVGKLRKADLVQMYSDIPVSPYVYRDVLITTSATEYDILGLSEQPDLSYDVRCVIVAMVNTFAESKPNIASWHLPFVKFESMSRPTDGMIASSLARCMSFGEKTYRMVELSAAIDALSRERISACGHIAFISPGLEGNFSGGWRSLSHRFLREKHGLSLFLGNLERMYENETASNVK